MSPPYIIYIYNTYILCSLSSLHWISFQVALLQDMRFEVWCSLQHIPKESQLPGDAHSQEGEADGFKPLFLQLLGVSPPPLILYSSVRLIHQARRISVVANWSYTFKCLLSYVQDQCPYKKRGKIENEGRDKRQKKKRKENK